MDRGENDSWRDPERLLLDAAESCRAAKIGRTKFYQLVARGELPVVRIGRSIRVPKDALEEWIRRRTAGGER